MQEKFTKTNWQKHLSEWIPNKLPGEKSHVDLSPMRGLSSETLKTAISPKESAVAVHLFEENNDLQIVLTKRNAYDGAHSAQVSFPGGKKEPSDPNLIFTAKRESWEEIGLPLETGDLIGHLTEIYIPVSNFKVQPFVFFHENDFPILTPDPREVESIFFLSSSVLLHENTLQYKTISVQKGVELKNIPCFVYQDYTIWGATAIVLNELKWILREFVTSEYVRNQRQ